MCKPCEGFSLTVLIEPLTFYLIVWLLPDDMLEENVEVDSLTRCSLSLILVIIERESPSVPFRTRQGNPVSPMVLWLKPRKSRSSPELNSI